MSKHTQGPWQVEVTRANLWIGTPKGSKIDDVVCDLEYGEEYMDDYRQRQLANANLIAAAPEMWDALQMCKDRLGKDFPQIGHDALAKAEGRQ